MKRCIEGIAAEMARKYRSKRYTTCSRCGEPIEPGEMIEWDRNEGTTHADKRECEAVEEVFDLLDEEEPAQN